MSNFLRTLNEYDFSKLPAGMARDFMEQFKKIDFKKYKNIDYEKCKISITPYEPEWIIDMRIMNKKDNFGFQLIVQSYKARYGQVDFYFTEWDYVAFEESFTVKEAINFLKDQLNFGTKIKKVYWQGEDELKGISWWDYRGKEYYFEGEVWSRSIWEYFLFWKMCKKPVEIKKEVHIKWK